MRKNLLGLSIAAMIGGLGLAGTASAGVAIVGTGTATATTANFLRTATDGVGHILLAPYFTTQSGNSTLLSIVNTDTTNGKAVKVRFRGAANSDDIFDFQVYLSPGDVWTANVSQNAAGLSQLTTNDASCTIPSRSVLNSTPFVTGRLPTTFTAAQAAEWTREGYVEILTMADIPPLTVAPVAPATANTNSALFTAIKHVGGVAPGCPAGETTGAALLALNTDPASEAAAVALGFNTPTASLMGSATIINVAGAAAAWSANLDAVVGVNTLVATNANTDYVAGRGRIVFSPQTAIAAATPASFTADPLMTASPVLVAAANYDLPDLSTPYLTAAAANTPNAQAEMLTTSLAVMSVQNEYLTTNAVITAATDWTFTMPTRRYAAAFNYAGTTAATRRVLNSTSTYFNTTNVSVSGNLLCVNPGTGTSATSWGQDEQSSSVTTGFVISPSTLAPDFAFCGEAAVLGFSTVAANNVLGATIARQTPGTAPIATAGWQVIPTPGLSSKGLPILGSSYVKVTGPVVNGASTNFSMTNGHRVTRPAAAVAP